MKRGFSEESFSASRSRMTAALQQEGEDLTRLFLELDANAMLAQLSGAKVELKNAEAYRVYRQRGLFHVVIRGDVGEYSPAGGGRQRSGIVIRASKWFIFFKTACDE